MPHSYSHQQLGATNQPRDNRRRLRKLQFPVAFAALLILALFSAYWVLPTASQSIVINSLQDKNSSQSGKSQECTTCSPGKQRVIFAPLFDLPEAQGSEIVLNCRSAHDVPITPTFYTQDGKAFVGEEIILHPAEMRFVDTMSLVPAQERGLHKWGGMSFSYFGGYMEAWAQLTLHGINGGGSTNVLFSVMSQRRSNTSDAVWWVPRDGNSLVALSNSSDQPVHANLIFSTRKTQAVDIGPNATEILRLDSEGFDRSSLGHAESVNISYTGANGSLIPTGFTSSPGGKFVSMIRFYDTQRTLQQNLFATNLRIKDSEPHMVLKNTSAEFIEATPTFLSAAGKPEDTVSYSSVRLAPHEVREIDLRQVVRQMTIKRGFESASVKVLNSGTPGSLIGALYSINRKTGTPYDVPLRDSGPPRASTGGYPIRLEGDYTTIISITNVTEKRTEFTMQVNYEGGHYVIGLVTAEPGETRTFDFRKLRDSGIPDVYGNPFPQDVNVAQARWSVRGAGRLTGRSEVVSKKDAVSSSYSCFLCCPDTFGGGWVTPPSPTIMAIGNQGLTAWERDDNGYYCGGGGLPYPVYAYWNTWDPSVATVDYTGEVTGLSEGWATIAANWTIHRWEWDDLDESCNDWFENFETYASPQVVCAIPTNFHQVGSGSDTGGGTLHFDYAWSSSTGNLAHLSACRVGEKVDYNAADIPFPSPPFPANLSPDNPTDPDGPGNSGAGEDNHSTPGTFVTPYAARSVVATQIYRYHCPCHNNNAWETLLGPHNITRSVSQNPNGSWKFTITKTGASATINPLP